jgi:menaquinone-9 beta-reductase
VQRCDAVVVGAGPAGAVTALCLARAGARVALVDKRRFPRDKACGDLIGPRGVRLLADLGLALPGARPAGDMIVIAPNGSRALLPALAGVDYAGHALAITRHRFDAVLVEAALAAGAAMVHERVVGLDGNRVHLAGGDHLTGDVIVGADGAMSQTAEAAGLVDERRALWGFALRSYVDAPVELPYIVLWEPRRWQLFPGYGWVFPTADGGANVGLGLAVGARRQAARRASEHFREFLRHAAHEGLLPNGGAGGQRLGGWLKMGAVGTDPARENVLLVGDAAGLINPLQGEGIAQAMASGRAAAAAIVAGPAGAAERYRTALRAMTGHHRVNAPVQVGMIRHPVAVSVVARMLTAPLVRNAVAGAWSLYWNDLVSGAAPSRHRVFAEFTGRLVAVTTRGHGNRLNRAAHDTTGG